MEQDTHSAFAGRVDRLENNVYGSVKGQIRLALLTQDLREYCPDFTSRSLNILDIGGGSGRFARICAQEGHAVLLLDVSAEMLARAEKSLAESDQEVKITLLRQDFLAEDCLVGKRFDLVLLHGSAEWMSAPEAAIEKACSCVCPGGYLSLLVFNKDRLTLKRGINGMLLQREGKSGRKIHTLTPPGALSPIDITKIIEKYPGKICSKSGIRVFHKFFREGVSEDVLAPDAWLQQERLYFRQEPFASLGEHTHFIWQAKA